MVKDKIIILGIESSCDDTSAAVVENNMLLSTIIASQTVHSKWGGVVPELASRAHQINIIPVVDSAIKEAGVSVDQIDAIAYTCGPGLLGSLLVGTSFAKGLSISIKKPLIQVNHLQGHILSPFIKEQNKESISPDFPFLTLLVSGGHTQIVKVNSYYDFQIIGSTIDDAVGEAFDKCSKMMGLGYPGGPIIDKMAKEGDPLKFKFNLPKVGGLDYSFSGIKTSLLYFLRDQLKENENFIEENKNDICASFQKALIDILMKKLTLAASQTGIKDISIGGGVSANSALRERVISEGEKRGWRTFVPEFKFTTDNAAMIAICGYYKFLRGEFGDLTATAITRF